MVTIDKHCLTLINDRSNKINYNRALNRKYIAKLPDDTAFEVAAVMIHEHKNGKRVEPHVRCQVRWNEASFVRIGFLDIHMASAKVLFGHKEGE